MSAQNVVEFDPNPVASFLRRAHPYKTAEHVADALDIPVETVRQWLRGVSKPNYFATLALVGAYGPEFLAVALPSLSASVKRWLIAERRHAATNEIRRLQKRLGDLDNADSLEGAAAPAVGGGVGARLPGRQSDARPRRIGGACARSL